MLSGIGWKNSFYSQSPFCTQSAVSICTQSAFCTWSAVCILYWKNNLYWSLPKVICIWWVAREDPGVNDPSGKQLIWCNATSLLAKDLVANRMTVIGELYSRTSANRHLIKTDTSPRWTLNHLPSNLLHLDPAISTLLI